MFFIFYIHSAILISIFNRFVSRNDLTALALSTFVIVMQMQSR